MKTFSEYLEIIQEAQKTKEKFHTISYIIGQNKNSFKIPATGSDLIDVSKIISALDSKKVLEGYSKEINTEAQDAIITINFAGRISDKPGIIAQIRQGLSNAGIAHSEKTIDFMGKKLEIKPTHTVSNLRSKGPNVMPTPKGQRVYREPSGAPVPSNLE